MAASQIAAGYAKANASGSSGLKLLAKYVDAGSTSTREWVRALRLNGARADKVAVDARGDVIVASTRRRRRPKAGALRDIVTLWRSTSAVMPGESSAS